MRVVVLGAGVIGVTSAWYLAQAGHEVTVIDRQPCVANETSFANGGQISVSQSEPWASPHVIAKIIRWLGREDAPLLFRFKFDWQQIAWGLRFLRECRAERFRQNVRHMVALARYSRTSLQALRAELGLQYDQQCKGILQLYTRQADYQKACEMAGILSEFTFERVIKTPDEAVAIEPALAASRERLVGAFYAAEDESGDARQFTTALASHAEQAGVQFRLNTAIQSLQHAGGRIIGVQIAVAHGVQNLSADAYVVALGSYSPLLLKPLGISIPVYPAKGYSATFSTAGHDLAPYVSMTDEEHLMVFSRLGDRLRVAGTAEINGYNLELNAVRCEALRQRTMALFPYAADYSQPLYWTGLRPATPNNCPLIGRSQPFENLYLNTGHGTLGWTESCGSARALAAIISGEKPEIDYPFL